MILNKNIFYLAVLVLSPICLACAQTDKEIERFTYLLSRDSKPTLVDYYYFCGHGSEDEIALELKYCKSRGWTPELENSKCLGYMKDLWNNRNSTPSQYFAWLKTLLPSNPKVKIHKVEPKRGKNILEHDLVFASLNGTNVIFFRPIGNKIIRHEFGNLCVSYINETSINKLFKKYLKN